MTTFAVVGFSRALKLAIFFITLISTVTIVNVAYTSATVVAPINGLSIVHIQDSIHNSKLEEYPARGLERFGQSSSSLAGAWVYVCVFGILVITCIARVVKAYWASAKGDDFVAPIVGHSALRGAPCDGIAAEIEATGLYDSPIPSSKINNATALQIRTTCLMGIKNGHKVETSDLTKVFATIGRLEYIKNNPNSADKLSKSKSITQYYDISDESADEADDDIDSHDSPTGRNPHTPEGGWAHTPEGDLVIDENLRRRITQLGWYLDTGSETQLTLYADTGAEFHPYGSPYSGAEFLDVLETLSSDDSDEPPELITPDSDDEDR